MSRPLRLEFEGAVWHVTARGNERREVFKDDDDRSRFLGVLGDVVERARWRLHAYVLMGNHYHLLVETPVPTLSFGMRQLDGIYGQRFNRRHGRVGHLFQGRFKGILVQREAHLLELVRYVVRNPVAAGLVARAVDWPWSSYRATAGLEPAPAWLDADWTLDQFGASRSRARRRYREFVEEGSRTAYRPWDALRGQVYLGDDAFLTDVAGRLDEGNASREVPRSQRQPAVLSFERLVAAAERVARARLADLPRSSTMRKVIAHVLRTETLSSYREIGEVLGVGEWAAGHLARQGEALASRPGPARQARNEIVTEAADHGSQT